LTLLRGDRVTKRFGGVQALSEVSFSINAGEIFGLIGPNGAGKTTLFNVLTGLYAPDAGAFLFDGHSLTGLKPHEVAAARHCAHVSRTSAFSPTCRRLENVMIGRHLRSRAGVVGAVLRDRKTVEEERQIEARRGRAARLWSGSAAARTTPRGSLPYGDQRRLEIARALATERSCSRSTSLRRAMNAAESLALRKLIQAVRRSRRHRAAHRARRAPGDECLRPGAGAGLREKIAEGASRGSAARSQSHRAYLGTPHAA